MDFLTSTRILLNHFPNLIAFAPAQQTSRQARHKGQILVLCQTSFSFNPDFQIRCFKFCCVDTLSDIQHAGSRICVVGPHILVSIDVPLDIQNLPGRYVQNLLDSRLSSDSRCSFRISGIIDASHAAIEAHFTYFQIPRKSLEWNSSTRIWLRVLRSRFCRSSPNREDIERRFSGNVPVYDYYSVTENEHTSKRFRFPESRFSECHGSVRAVRHPFLRISNRAERDRCRPPRLASILVAPAHSRPAVERALVRL